MKLKQLLLIVICSTFLSAYSSNKTESRKRINFNSDWKFLLEDKKEFCSEEYDDSSWRTINLPHDWSVEAEFSKENSGRNAWLPGGIAWYRKTFELPANYDGKNIEIQFDGIYKNASIWVNNHPVGQQHDGYTSFYFEISELLKFGESNTIAVRVDNSVQPNCRWYSGSGIYRNTWLTISNKTHVATWGTFISTPSIDKEKAHVEIITTIKNLDVKKNLNLETVIYDPQGNKVISSSSEIEMERYRDTDIKQELVIPNPQLWELEDTKLYTAISIITSDKGIEDEYKTTFGVREITFDAEKGFFLNGKNMKMKGICLHHEAGSLGAAVPKAVWRRRLLKLKSIGCNAIRTAHNPTSVEFLDLCDELGLLVMDEFVDKWENPYKKPTDKKDPFFDVPFADQHFSSEWKKNFGQTIRRDRNHPSVIIWSVGNENHAPGSAEENHGMKKYGAFVRSIDPTRPVISGMERGRDKAVADKVNDIIETCEYMDLIALNYGEQWCKLIADKKPGKAYVSTESYVYFNSALEKRFANIERSPWLDVLDNDNNMGLFLWVGIDYLGESKSWPHLGSTSGLLTAAGFRKNSSYLYEAFWSDKPMVHLEVYERDADDFSKTGRWGWPQMNEKWNFPKDSVLDVVTYTNCETVDLYLNNKKLGSQKLADFPNWIVKWRKISHKAGTLRAVGKINGKVVCESELHTTSKAHHIILNSDLQNPKANDLVHIEISLSDKKGNRVSIDDKELQFELEGDGEIIALDNGDNSNSYLFRNKKSRSTHKGRCLCIVKLGSNRTQKLKLTVSGNDLKASSIAF
ncbi:glycoside hydrolase family 2 [Labilibaculum filiforme]|uniref:Glycoside hydrolase family 2 n=1 Tax=Labilibaculum filiforme TaxID=1940526 RepID=A0A2N3HUK1_9BACT|nr:glycoside hydrolase family 2 TIM barrel-domain containing protein [Labilibaculum filiforme]PKQ61732.1 glycoside hydrolase family 2 [Labilibaculum filiforme]